jgi:hypothetical protein
MSQKVEDQDAGFLVVTWQDRAGFFCGEILRE